MRRSRKEIKVLAGKAAGFSIVELIIAVAIAMVAAIGIYAVFTSQNKESISQRAYSDAQNNLRYAMDFMKNELFLAGFMPKENVDAPILAATGSEITFEYFDENLELAQRIRSDLDAGLDPNDYTKHIKVKYSLENPVTKSDGVVVKDLVRTTWVYNNQPDPLNPPNKIGYEAATPGSAPNLNKEVLARDIVSAGGLAFSYRNNANMTWSASDPLEDIRTIRITLKGRANKPNPYTKTYQTLRVSGEVKARNLEISENPFDDIPPPTPTFGTGDGVRDPGECGRLSLKWPKSNDPFLKGYRVYYGLAPGDWIGYDKVNPSGTAVETAELRDLSSYDAEYYIAIRAYDESGNMSPFSATLNGDPTPDSTDFSNNINDSTINPAVPLPPTNLAASLPNDNEVHLEWQKTATNGVIGYRLFRATQPDFSDEVLLANETTLVNDPADPAGQIYSYTDTASPTNTLLGCQTYYYRIASIHCDASMFDLGTYVATDYAEISAIPTDGAPPATPNLVARAGYRRVILNVQNPSRAPAADPDFDYTEIYYSTAGYPTITGVDAQNHPIVSGTLIPDNPNGAGAGIITAQGSVPPINFNSETAEFPPQPELSATLDYYFLAIAYDTCGNHSEVTDEARDLGVQCGDCPPPSVDPTSICDEVPPGQLPTAIGVQGCDYSMDFGWTAPNDTTYYDHAGFHVYRREGNTWLSGDPATEVRLTGSNATWFTNWQDSIYSWPYPMEMGKKYSYKICSVDCYFDQHEGKSPSEWPDPTDDPDDNFNCVTVDDANTLNALYLGEFREAASRNTAITGDILLEFLDVPLDFRHHTSTFFVDNLAAGPMTQETVQLSWDNPNAFLAGVWVGDGSTTSREVVYNPLSQPPVPSGTNISFTPPKSVDGLDDNVPMTFRFTKADGSIDRTIDMRQENFITTLSSMNNSTGTSPCYQYGNLFVPNGPDIRTVVQDKPTSPTNSWPVPGDSGTNVMNRIIVGSDVGVTVRAVVLDTFPSTGIAEVRLFYFIDPGAILPSPPDITDFNITNSILMSNVAGSLYQTVSPIPAANDSNVWFFILARDNNGNFDRAPEIHSGAFQYYQQPADICNNTPTAPALSGTSGAASVSLFWSAPTFNTDGSMFTDQGGYNVYRSGDGGTWTNIGTTLAGATSFTDSPANIDTVNYSYYVTAFDTCPVPGPKESDPSNVFSECEGAPNCILTAQPSAGVPMHPGNTIGVSMTVCSKQNGTPGDIVYVQACTDVGGINVGADADPIQMVEVGDTGFFEIDSTLYGGRTEIQVHDSASYPASPVALDLEANDTADIVSIGAWSDTPYSDSICATGTFSCDEQTFTVVPDPCVNPATPGTPTGLTVSPQDGNCSSARAVSLSWTAPASGPVTSYDIWLCEDPACATKTNIDSTTGTTYPATGGYDVGSKVNTGDFIFTVTAVNESCVTDPKVSTMATPAVDPCL